MSAWRIAGMVHALEGWEENACGFNAANMIPNYDRVWQATLRYGFEPLKLSTSKIEY